ncbi:hypothetical protein D3C72_2433740 [compost metagenome]
MGWPVEIHTDQQKLIHAGLKIAGQHDLFVDRFATANAVVNLSAIQISNKLVIGVIDSQNGCCHHFTNPLCKGKFCTLALKRAHKK